MLFVGVIVMVLGTYANLQAVEEAKNFHIVTEKVPPVPQVALKPNIVEPEKPVVMDIPTTSKLPPTYHSRLLFCSVKIVIPEEKKQKPPDEPPKLAEAPPPEQPKKEERPKEVRHEPPQPEEPVENQETQKPGKTEEKKVEKTDKQEPVVEPVQPADDKLEEQRQKETIQKVIKEAINEKKPVEVPDETKKEKEVKKSEEVDIEAIKKEESELKEQEDKKEKDPNQILLDTIQKQNEVQKEIVEQQKKLIEVIQKHQENQDVDKVNEEKVKAVKQIEDIAKRAIESISGKDNKNAPENMDKQDEESLAAKEPGPIPEEKKTDRKKVEQRGEKITERKEEKTGDNKTGVVEVNLKPKQIKDQDKVKMVPLPIVLAQLNNATLEAKVVEMDAKNKTNKKESDVKAMRRDILSESESAKARTKREVSDSKMENLNNAVKEVCEELSKSTSTEKPIIKMLCKLSEPNLEPVDLGVLENQTMPDVQPQKRDLKQFAEK